MRTTPADTRRPTCRRWVRGRRTTRHVGAALLAALLLVVLLPFANRLYAVLAQPLLQKLPGGGQMIAIDPISPFFTPLKLVLVLALVLVVLVAACAPAATPTPGVGTSVFETPTPGAVGTPTLGAEATTTPSLTETPLAGETPTP